MNKNMNTWIWKWVMVGLLLLDLKIIKPSFSQVKWMNIQELAFILTERMKIETIKILHIKTLNTLNESS